MPPDIPHGKMTTSMAITVLNESAKLTDSMHVTWHGGEPLLKPVDFYEAISKESEKLRNNGVRVRNSIKSNGTLISDKLLDFISRQQDFGLGVSLDGPKEINDRARKFVKGKSSFGAVFHGLRKIKSMESPERRRMLGGVICVVGNHNLGSLHEILDFFSAEEIDVAFNPISPSGHARDINIPTDEQYAEAFCDLFDYWADMDTCIEVNPFVDIISSLARCSIPDDHIAPRRSALFMARWVVTEARDGRATC